MYSEVHIGCVYIRRWELRSVYSEVHKSGNWRMGILEWIQSTKIWKWVLENGNFVIVAVLRCK